MATFFCPVCEEQREFELVVQSGKYKNYRCTYCRCVLERINYRGLKATNLKVWEGKFEECLSCKNRPKVIADNLPSVCEQCRRLNPINYASSKGG